MEDCIFCKIINKEKPAHIVYEDEQFMAILDVFPRVKGHTLLIPKTHARWVNDVEPFGRYWEVARTIAKKLQKHLNTEYLSYVTLGDEVPHAHIHIMPQQEVGAIKFGQVVSQTNEDLSALAAEIIKLD
ncbi:MAG: HIT family protein [Weeksellaceae bacterium]